MEQTPNTFVHLFWAYTAIWACIVVFLLSLAKDLRKQRQQILALESEIRGKQSPS